MQPAQRPSQAAWVRSATVPSVSPAAGSTAGHQQRSRRTRTARRSPSPGSSQSVRAGRTAAQGPRRQALVRRAPPRSGALGHPGRSRSGYVGELIAQQLSYVQGTVSLAAFCEL